MVLTAWTHSGVTSAAIVIGRHAGGWPITCAGAMHATAALNAAVRLPEPPAVCKDTPACTRQEATSKTTCLNAQLAGGAVLACLRIHNWHRDREQGSCARTISAKGRIWE